VQDLGVEEGQGLDQGVGQAAALAVGERGLGLVAGQGLGLGQGLGGDMAVERE